MKLNKQRNKNKKEHKKKGQLKEGKSDSRMRPERALIVQKCLSWKKKANIQYLGKYHIQSLRQIFRENFPSCNQSYLVQRIKLAHLGDYRDHKNAEL